MHVVRARPLRRKAAFGISDSISMAACGMLVPGPQEPAGPRGPQSPSSPTTLLAACRYNHWWVPQRMPAHAASRCFWINDRISVAACGMLVPGPKIALTPAFFRKS